MNNDYGIDLQDVVRVEVIDKNGRSYVNWNGGNKVRLMLQDDERTLKVYIGSRDEKLKNERMPKF